MHDTDLDFYEGAGAALTYGASLRHAGTKRFSDMASGSRKARGGFWLHCDRNRNQPAVGRHPQRERRRRHLRSKPAHRGNARAQRRRRINRRHRQRSPDLDRGLETEAHHLCIRRRQRRRQCRRSSRRQRSEGDQAATMRRQGLERDTAAVSMEARPLTALANQTNDASRPASNPKTPPSNTGRTLNMVDPALCPSQLGPGRPRDRSERGPSGVAALASGRIVSRGRCLLSPAAVRGGVAATRRPGPAGRGRAPLRRPQASCARRTGSAPSRSRH